MRATTIHAPFDVRLSEVPDPVISKPTDAIIKIVAGCICGSDLWPYRGENKITPGSRIGHEYVGIVQEVGAEVRTVKPGDFVVTPFVASDGTCPNCRAGLQSVCQNLVGIGSDGADGGQGEYAKVPWADGTLVATPEVPDDSLVPSLLTLSDVMGTGWHAARAARVKPGDTVVVVGDGAVGLCGVLAASRMGAERVVALSRHEPRQKIASEFGATQIIAERGDEATTAVLELTGGVGADAVLECVGTNQSFETAFAVARPGATVGFVGVPHGVEVPIRRMFGRNVGLAGGVAPARAYLPDLMADVLSGEINPGLVFDLELPLDQVAEGYQAMHERRAIKVLLRP
ncbi:threonine dehydrogenase-like Zn-dependent dehydrogenase [Kribbella orskensis]|uniref:Threonine dehydrogenase-like Zn-dependent dehydrogenase n=1 Tax=Kribbella orskensis TaxID=2512216 RepID=A0ABY2BQN3_9ACTN|nr:MULTISPECIES: zinc-dependent alcohol dehydrogenase family protein [Kribbella]TCN37161.1 threonine dehydrogenase-like Zn-dependent dehydrogenase [Kribbella sp. VKM Ac-2500]TCO27931.1 threonine dehydrogenase-like Zn-dependent dehydrogenase [Kribbella orskensis]